MTSREACVRWMWWTFGTVVLIVGASLAAAQSAMRLRKGRRLIVRGARDDASCGLSGRVGELTGLFLTRTEDRWTSGSCHEIAASQMRRLIRSKSGGATDERCSTRG